MKTDETFDALAYYIDEFIYVVENSFSDAEINIAYNNLKTAHNEWNGVTPEIQSESLTQQN